MEHVTSSDGTTIGFDRLGQGPPVVLVCGGSVDRMSNAPVAELLAADHTAFNYDRRGRGDSGDTQPYAVDREIEDIAAVVDAAGGSAFLYGTSSGAVLALKARRSSTASRSSLYGSRPTSRTGSRALRPTRRRPTGDSWPRIVVAMPSSSSCRRWWACPTSSSPGEERAVLGCHGSLGAHPGLRRHRHGRLRHAGRHRPVGLDPHAGPGRSASFPWMDQTAGAWPTCSRTDSTVAGGADARRRSLGDHACAGSVLRRLTAYLASPGRRCGARRTRRSGGPRRPSAPGTRARRVHRRTSSAAPRACPASRGTAAGSGRERHRRRGS